MQKLSGKNSSLKNESPSEEEDNIDLSRDEIIEEPILHVCQTLAQNR
jgi:hypothetical protein